MRVVTVSDLSKIIAKIGIGEFLSRVRDRIEYDFSRWNEFDKSPRPACHLPEGVIEVMPTCDGKFYSFKYVNGHPVNTERGKLCVAAIGLLSDASSGYPILISEMTVLTAVRTAATSALAAKYLARSNSSVLAMLGTGAQAEFQILALSDVCPIKQVKLFDIDGDAMKKTRDNLSEYSLEILLCNSADEILEDCDILTTATAAKTKNELIPADFSYQGMHINGIGGDCPGKTELPMKVVKSSKVFVEFIEQSAIEGEIQVLKDTSDVTELWKVINGESPGRESEEDITLFDSVGFAIEDFSVLLVVNECCEETGIGHEMDLIPDVEDPKNLFSVLSK